MLSLKLVSRTEAKVSTKTFSTQTQSLLCDLCAMLPLNVRFPHRCHGVPQDPSTPNPNPHPSSVTSVTSVRCLPLTFVSRTDATVSPKALFTPGMPRSRGHPNWPRDRSIAKPQDPRRDWCFRTPRRPPPPAPCRKPRLPSVR